MKILVSCVSGMGSSQMIKMKITNVLKKVGLEATIDHMAVDAAKTSAKNYDAVFCSAILVSNFKVSDTTKIMGLRNLLSEAEIEQALRDNGFLGE